MRNDICTIPINEAFENKEECPLCYMHRMLEKRIVDYIMGAAMMEPDVRIETNKKGFCHRHFEQMIGKGNRLGLALILDSHLKELKEGLSPAALKKEKTSVKSCFVCEKIEWGFSRMVNQIYSLYSQEKQFREIYDGHQNICLPHAERLFSNSKGKIKGKLYNQFCQSTYETCEMTLSGIIGDIEHFSSMFDYRNRGGDFGDSKDAPERAVKWLSGLDAQARKND